MQCKYNTNTLKPDHENLEERHQRFIIQYGHDGSEAEKGTIKTLSYDVASWIEITPCIKID